MLSAKSRTSTAPTSGSAWISTPKVQAQQAVYFGETPVNKLACKQMDKIAKGSCKQYHVDAPLVLLQADPLLEDAGRRLRQRQEGLHGLHEVAAGWTQIKG